MAEFEFSITLIEANLKDQSIYIYFTLELDEDSVNPDNIFLAVRNNNTGKNDIVPYDININGNILRLKLNSWAVPNTKYTLLIQSGIKSITDDNLDTAIVRNFMFKSEVTSTIDIISPSDFEEVSNNSFICNWQEIGENKTNKYFLEVSTDNAFFNPLIQTVIRDKCSFTTSQLKAGQYYIRIRAENNDSYGYWSPTKTFIINNENNVDNPEVNPPDESDKDDDSPIIEKDESLKIISTNENGITPISFDIVFNEDIDMSEAKITIIRSDF